MKQSLVQEILRQVRNSYSVIALDFSHTRQENWSILDYIAQKYVRSGQKVLDVGCGSGRLVKLFSALDRDIFYTGLDSSPELLSIARNAFSRHYKQVSCQWQEGELYRLPFQKESFDHVFVVASLHHIPSSELRKQACDEFVRVLKPNGILVLVNWNLWTLSACMKYGLFRQMFFNSFCGYDWGDFFIPWRGGAQYQHAVMRYYHSFTNGELRKMFSHYSMAFLRQQTVQLGSNNVSKSFVTVVQKLRS